MRTTLKLSKNRRRILFTALLVLSLSPMPCVAQSRYGKLYFLEDSAKHEWCGFDNKVTWRTRVDSVSALKVASVKISAGRIDTLDVTEGDEAGDWIVYDRYSFGPHLKLESLDRVMNVLPGDRSVKQRFVNRGGRLKLQHEIILELSTGQVVTDSSFWRPGPTVVSDAQEFPFWQLVASRRADVWRHGVVCIHSGSDR